LDADNLGDEVVRGDLKNADHNRRSASSLPAHQCAARAPAEFANERFGGALRHMALRAATAVREKNPLVTRMRTRTTWATSSSTARRSATASSG
jgi:hypothetical protein